MNVNKVGVDIMRIQVNYYTSLIVLAVVLISICRFLIVNSALCFASSSLWREEERSFQGSNTALQKKKKKKKGKHLVAAHSYPRIRLMLINIDRVINKRKTILTIRPVCNAHGIYQIVLFIRRETFDHVSKISI